VTITIRGIQLLNPLFGGGSYADKVLAYSPIAYWPLWEATGSVAACLVNPLQNGTYSGVTLGQEGIGDGRTCPLFDGVNDHVDLYSAALAAAFNGAEGTIHLWYKVYNAGVWTDSVHHMLFEFAADAGNNIRVYKEAANNSMYHRYRANSQSKSQSNSPINPTTWVPVAVTWSKTDDKVRFYAGGVQWSNTHTSLGTWAGSLSSTATVLGDIATTPSIPWYGYLAHMALWDTPLSADDLADLAVIA
jgi:hypothetical protein